MAEILKLNLLIHERPESSWGALWLGIRMFWLSWRVSSASGCMAEILKFNLLTNERLESSRDALWLGIRMFLVLMECIIGFQVHGRNPKI